MAPPPDPDRSDPDRTDESGRTDEPGRDRVEERALLLPEEIAAGSDDPEAQAEAILAESDRRRDDPEQTQQESPQSPDI